jgi:GTPase Era involved in 16S rRNA processing
MALSHNTKFCIVGGVSTGKSTFLNGAFCEKLTQCKIKRTTMVPTCYVENDKATDSIEYIYKTISEKNKSIIEKTEKGLTKLDPEDYNELIFNVGKLDINFIGSNGHIEMYDIPGLNDARTKQYYYKYLDENFYKFNVIIMFVDINSGLNTSDEMDMLNFIITHTKYHKEKGRDIYTLIVVNKADDMTLEDGKLVINGELNEMFQLVQNQHSNNSNINNNMMNKLKIIENQSNHQFLRLFTLFFCSLLPSPYLDPSMFSQLSPDWQYCC